jgi:hypothetical protein
VLCCGCRCRESTATTLRQVQELEARRDLSGPQLLRGLQHRDPAVRARVALALGRIGVTRGQVIDQLERRLSDPSATVRRSATFALRLLVLDTPVALGQQALARRVSRKLLSRLARERDSGCRGELMRSLGWIGSKEHAPELGRALAASLKPPAERQAALEALVAWKAVRLTPALVEGLSASMASRSTEEQTLVAMVVVRAGGTKHDALFKALRRAGEAEEPTLARWATRAVYRSDTSKDTIDWLARQFRDHRPVVQIAAAEGLAQAGADSKERLARLVLLLWRSVSANHFRLTGPQLRPVLRSLDLLSSGPCGPDTDAAAKQLLELTDVTDSTVSYDKKEGLAVDLVHCAAARLADQCSGELGFTPRCGTAKSEWMTRGMRKALVARTIASSAMSEKKGPAWQVEQLAALAGDVDPLVQAAALAALGRVRVKAAEGERVAKLLTTGLEGRDPRPVAAAAAALVELSDHLEQSRFEQPLLRALRRQKTPGAACQIARALGRLSGRAKAAVELARKSPVGVKGVRGCAVRDLKPPTGSSLLGATGFSGFPGREERREREERKDSWKDLLPRRAKVVTTRGVVWLRLLTDEAPEAIRRLAALLKRKRYRRVRVTWREPLVELRISDGKPAPMIPCEPSPEPFKKGSVGLGLPAGRDSSQGELVFCLERRPELDGRITRVAEVEPGGLEVLRRLLPGDWVKGIYLHRPAKAGAKKP